MRSMKYLPSMSTIQTLKYLRQLLNNSLQKLTSTSSSPTTGSSLDVNRIVDKYVSNYKKLMTTSVDKRQNTSSISSGQLAAATTNATDGRLADTDVVVKQVIDKTTTTPPMPKKDIVVGDDEEYQLFESALNEWIQTKHQLDANLKTMRPSTVTTMMSSTTPTPGLDKRIEQLVNSMTIDDSLPKAKRNLQDLTKLLITYPTEAITYANKHNAIHKVLQLNHWTDNQLIRQQSSQVLAHLGYVEPPKGTGIRILSIDGGGTRGVLVIEILRELERLSGKPIHQMFDLICGVSTGGIIGMLMGALQLPVDECEEYYHRFSSHLFKSDFFRGAGRLLWSHAYYDTNVWEKILRDIYRETTLMETRQSDQTPHVVAISALMNKPSIEAYLFRNYELPVHTRSMSQYEGSSRYKIWQAVRASAAAPGYFEEMKLDQYVHQDGGILINNPTAVAIHEAKLLWPNEDIQFVLSLGSGRSIPSSYVDNNTIVANTSLKQKLAKLIDSATDTEMVHRLMRDLLPADTYLRINPFLSEVGSLDENRPQKLSQMKSDAKLYLRKNEPRVTQAVSELMNRRKLRQRLEDWLRLQYNLRIK
ncbi:calcium-independent phospholipase A2-gamma-like [Oppia nitens]|uniref:calcium-independent phospholipase A2-gamma-like n=1 Tax=Oppia nitens TaxID=1686743 RepID=UPI0023D9D87B|nr:calcium-independent phospholipase A2-gamma-like [Oppia nitens]